jgi:hypothetical protein
LPKAGSWRLRKTGKFVKPCKKQGFKPVFKPKVVQFAKTYDLASIAKPPEVTFACGFFIGHRKLVANRSGDLLLKPGLEFRPLVPTSLIRFFDRAHHDDFYIY